MEGNSNVGIIAAVSALLGGLAPIVAKFVIDLVNNKNKANTHVIETQLQLLRDERAENIRKSAEITADLQKQIFELRA
jgi:hypothetical protein